MTPDRFVQRSHYKCLIVCEYKIFDLKMKLRKKVVILTLDDNDNEKSFILTLTALINDVPYGTEN